MKRFITAIIILSALTAVSVVSLFLLRAETRRLTERVNDIIVLCEEECYDEAGQLAAELEIEWEGTSKRLNLFVGTDSLAPINASVSKIKPFIDEESDELTAELNSLKAGAQWLFGHEMPCWYNIF